MRACRTFITYVGRGVAALVMFGLAAAGASAQSETATVTDLIMVGRSPAVHAQINGHEALLEVDTGSFELRLTPHFVEKYQIKSPRVTLQIGGAPEFTLKPVVEDLEGDQPAPFAKNVMAHSDGIVGLDVLRKFALGFDTVNGKLAWWYGGHLSPESVEKWTGSAPAKMPLSSDGPDDWYRVDSQINRHPVKLVLDTGTAYATVNPSIAKRLRLRVVGETPVQEIGRSEDLKVAVADSLTFGDIAADFPVFNIESSDEDTDDGILGTEAIGNGAYVIDMPGMTFYDVHKNRERGTPMERRMREAGLDLFPTANDSLIVLVKTGSPAEKKGIHSGDELVAIGGVLIKDMFGSLKNDTTGQQTEKLFALAVRSINGELHVTVKCHTGVFVILPLPDD